MKPVNENNRPNYTNIIMLHGISTKYTAQLPQTFLLVGLTCLLQLSTLALDLNRLTTLWNSLQDHLLTIG